MWPRGIRIYEACAELTTAQLGETMNIMSELMTFSQEKKLRPEQALEAWVSQHEAQGANGQQNLQGNPQINLPPNGVPMGNRTPSMQQMPMPPNQPGNFSSPGMANLNLPGGMQPNGMNNMNGSPHLANQPQNPNLVLPAGNSHTPSPHLSHMAAPPMLPQHSQQGTNSSSAASANTSPNVNNKRRRSQVKMEGDEEGAMPQQRVKPSPRMTKKAKPGG